MQVTLILGKDFTLNCKPAADMYFPETGLHASKIWPFVQQHIDMMSRWVMDGQPFYIVTHSETLVDAIGEAICNKETSHSFSYMIFGEGSGTLTGRFDPVTGVPENWPAGFLSR